VPLYISAVNYLIMFTPFIPVMLQIHDG